ncbi:MULTISPECIES: L-lactate dehydrogenase [unclassified Microcystis]|uniref:L-lactate dehydrogenase n=1 Tax=unclassified Microcystis TaxID=2643300 RepID=UPI002588BA98|nr:MULTISPECIES: L-lactate dehydrogenase [unclassified Microcystis]MCA2762216.1 L-lactate dehydrogenase [Microcystis sp. M151S2]MCA2642005.1 L-lactate dehydrogenase [Microcystis sp. M087S2]MCA2672502.1 L-lactate dehydrogenase [Microcystis sp. M080S2]MCA2687029.1 L-lactate dehydrogenase [Microcystis sp. M037S2]MCA2735106.1 L-lactate dehydrogenase [Microcystis sp. M158S2]
MLDKIFTPNPYAEQPAPLRPRKGVIIGVGQVGMACAYSMLIQDCFDELILQDIATDKVEGEVMDLSHGMPFIEPTDLKMGTVADVGQNADVVIITAGAAQKEGETRLHLLERNVAIFRRILEDVAVYCPSALILVVSNPVDIMTYVTLKITNFPPSRVIGSGTVLDSGRLRSLLSTQLHVDARNVHAYIIGEHGDSELAVWSSANIGGARLLEGDWQDLSAANQESLTEIFLQVKNAAYEIIKRKGYTSYAIGLATTDIVKAILRSQERILTISTLLDGQYGLKDVCLSIPSVVNEKGVIKTLNLALSPRETQQLHNSAKIMRDLIDQLEI